MANLALVANATLTGASTALSLSWSESSMPRHTLRLVRRRLAPALDRDHGDVIFDLADTFPTGAAGAPWAVVDLWRFTRASSAIQGGGVAAELIEAYENVADTTPARIVVRVLPPSGAAPHVSEVLSVTRVTRTTAPGPGFESVTTISIFAAPDGGAETLMGTVVVSTQPTTPGLATRITDFTAGDAPEVRETVSPAANLFSWTPAGAGTSTSMAFAEQILECRFAAAMPSASARFALLDAAAPNGRAGLPLDVIGASGGSPILITTAADHGLSNGAWISIIGAAGNTAANGIWSVVVSAPNQFSLTASTGNGLYAGGGVVYPPLLRVAELSESRDVASGRVDCALTLQDGFPACEGLTSPASEIVAGETYYYSAFQSDADAAPPAVATAFATATGSYGCSRQLFDLLPAIHRYYDDPTNGADGQWQLRRFLGVFGPALDQVRGLSEALPSTFDIVSTRAEFLPQLASAIGWQLDRTLPAERQRQDLRFAPRIFGSIGTKPNIEALAKRATGWTCRAKEFVDNVLLTNAPETVRLWQIFEATRAGPTAAFAAPAIQANVYPMPAEPSVTQACPTRIDARPAAVLGADGAVWLFWHSTRLGSEWIGGTSYTAGAAPSVLAPLSAAGFVYVCTTAGVSGTTEPAFPTSPDATVADGTAIWTCTGLGIERRRIWLQRLGVDPTPVDALADLSDEAGLFDEAPSAVNHGGTIVLAWSSNRGAHVEIWSRTWSGGATAAGPASPLTRQKLDNRSPALAVAGGAPSTIQAAWESHGPNGSAIWIAASADGGATWSAPTPVSSGPVDRTPAVVVDPAGATHVFWIGEGAGGARVRHATSGASGWTATDVTSAEFGVKDGSPAAVVWSDTIWLFWHSNRFATPWGPSTTYSFGSAVTPPTPNGLWYECTAAGVGGVAVPAFPASEGGTVTDGDVVWLCRGKVSDAPAARSNRIWQAAGPTFASSSPALARISNDRQPTAVVGSGGDLRLFFASQETGARFRSRTFDTTFTSADERVATANRLARSCIAAYSDRLHYTNDSRRTKEGTVARDSIGLYLEASSMPPASDYQAILDRLRASLSPFRPLTARFVYFLKPADSDVFKPVGVDP